ncbi:hypothetical protein FOA52_006076 [Chlamydomonas sp. UWO 241]|nr:hypothetical protein FOA52_006076 [Chlamydomonas sp. UWO 241]
MQHPAPAKVHATLESVPARGSHTADDGGATQHGGSLGAPATPLPYAQTQTQQQEQQREAAAEDGDDELQPAQALPCAGAVVTAAAASQPTHQPGLTLTPLLPPQTGRRRKTLVLDLDLTLIETLVMRQAGSTAPDFVYTDSVGVRAQVWMRPGLKQFLAAVAEIFEVVLFTAAGQRHADAVLSHVDPSGSLIHHRLYLQHTRATPTWAWVKDLSRLGRPLSECLIVDDCEVGVLPRDNWVSIAPFSQAVPGWQRDSALFDILHFLRSKVLPADDVRTSIARHYDVLMCTPVRPAKSSDESSDDSGGGEPAAGVALVPLEGAPITPKPAAASVGSVDGSGNSSEDDLERAGAHDDQVAAPAASKLLLLAVHGAAAAGAAAAASAVLSSQQQHHRAPRGACARGPRAGHPPPCSGGDDGDDCSADEDMADGGGCGAACEGGVAEVGKGGVRRAARSGALSGRAC